MPESQYRKDTRQLTLRFGRDLRASLLEKGEFDACEVVTDLLAMAERFVSEQEANKDTV